MSFFQNAQGFAINNSHFTATNNTYFGGPTGIDILREAAALEAIHDSSFRSYSPRCFPGTREQHIEDIINRASPSLGDTPPPIYWMKGPAGVGKTAIAQTCAERMQEKGGLGASFFFSVSGQRKPEKFFPSIAYQLSTIHPAYRDLIDTKIRNDRTLVSKALQFQFWHLIDGPLRELEANGNGIRKRVHIFVDGLDECAAIDAQCEIIHIIAAATTDGILPLRWAFFSRPEVHLEATFSATGVAPYCYKAILPISRDADGEIELYLRNAFNNILQHHNPSVRTLWPSAEQMDLLVRGAGGSFIYATTVVQFVSRPNVLTPQKRLLIILNIILERHSRADTIAGAPLAELDTFYLLILRRIPMEALQSVKLLLALLCQFGVLGAMPAANLLEISKDEFETIYHHISAVVRFEEPGKKLELDPSINTSRVYTQTSIPDEVFQQVLRQLGGRVEFYHKSFYDFLLDSSRSGSYCISPSKALTQQLLKIHLKYDKIFLWRGSELVLAPSEPNMAAPLSYPYTNEWVNSLLNVCVYSWAGDEDAHGFPAPREGEGSGCDFHKWLHVFTSIEPPGVIYTIQIWGCYSRRKEYPGTCITYISPKQFPKSAIMEFKLMIKRREQASVIRRYHPGLTSRIKYLFHDKSREGIESALYRMGHGKKAIYWYWEFNNKLQSYREFRSVDLVEGEKRFREEDFESGPGWNVYTTDKSK